jgi:hypothetical protein
MIKRAGGHQLAGLFLGRQAAMGRLGVDLTRRHPGRTTKMKLPDCTPGNSIISTVNQTRPNNRAGRPDWNSQYQSG